ncbi:MAG: STAS domain-containing protein [Terriglobia bacterium]
MSLGVSERRMDDVVVLELSGRLTLGPDCAALDQRVEELGTAGTRAVLLHCEKLSAIDSQGIKLLVQATSRLREQGGRLTLCALPARVREVLQITRLLEVLETFPSEAEALASFKPARGAA